MNPIIKYVLVAFVVLGSIAGIYRIGSASGANEVQLRWNEERTERDKVSSDLVLKNSKLESENAMLTRSIEKEVIKNEEQFQEAIASVHAQYVDRLRLADSRAGVYRKQVQGSAIEREHLASYVSELDRSLEEGRSLVRELGETLKQRDRTIDLLRQQIEADRKLVE